MGVFLLIFMCLSCFAAWDNNHLVSDNNGVEFRESRLAVALNTCDDAFGTGVAAASPTLATTFTQTPILALAQYPPLSAPAAIITPRPTLTPTQCPPLSASAATFTPLQTQTPILTQYPPLSADMCDLFKGNTERYMISEERGSVCRCNRTCDAPSEERGSVCRCNRTCDAPSKDLLSIQEVFESTYPLMAGGPYTEVSFLRDFTIPVWSQGICSR